MKKYIFILLLLVSCDGAVTYEDRRKEEMQKHNAVDGMFGAMIYVVVVDNCEYVVFQDSNKGGIIHKANCKNQQHK